MEPAEDLMFDCLEAHLLSQKAIYVLQTVICHEQSLPLGAVDTTNIKETRMTGLVRDYISLLLITCLPHIHFNNR